MTKLYSKVLIQALEKGIVNGFVSDEQQDLNYAIQSCIAVVKQHQHIERENIEGAYEAGIKEESERRGAFYTRSGRISTDAPDYYTNTYQKEKEEGKEDAQKH